MQLKLTRSQREAGVLSTNVVFCLDARVEFTSEEQHSVTRYKLHNQMIYNSEASKRLLEKSAAQQDGSTLGSLKALATLAMVSLKLNISIASLQRGQHVECKSLEELVAAEDAIMAACQNLRSYLARAATFDGREVLFEFREEGPTIIAQASSPNPRLIAPLAAIALPPAPPPAALAAATEDAEFHDIAGSDETDAPFDAETDTSHELGFLDGLPFDIHDPQTKQRLVVIAIVALVALLWLVFR